MFIINKTNFFINMLCYLYKVDVITWKFHNDTLLNYENYLGLFNITFHKFSLLLYFNKLLYSYYTNI